MKEKELFCSFCGKPKELANRLIAGPNGVYICDECIEICKEVLNEEKVKHAEDYFDKHGAMSTFIGRLIPAVRQLISIPAGLARMKLHTFLLYTTLGAGIWNICLAVLGHYVSTIPGIDTQDKFLAKVTEYSHQIGYCFIALGVAIVAYLIYKGIKK